MSWDMWKDIVLSGFGGMKKSRKFLGNVDLGLLQFEIKGKEFSLPEGVDPDRKEYENVVNRKSMKMKISLGGFWKKTQNKLEERDREWEMDGWEYDVVWMNTYTSSENLVYGRRFF